MSVQKSAVKKNSSPKETLQNEITPLLAAALVSLKERLGEKKFNKRIKKATKILIHGVKPEQAKKEAVKKAPVEKKVKKAAKPAVKKAVPALKK